MDIFKLNSTTFHADGDPIEGYETAIWTERFAPAGEFEIHTQNIQETQDALPVGSFVGELNSQVAMMVDDHIITEDDNSGEEKLIVKGRSAFSFFENRAVRYDNSSSWFTVPYLPLSDVIERVLDDVTLDPHGYDQDDLPFNVINLAGSDSPEAGDYFPGEPGDLYAEIQGLLSRGHHGMSSYRPSPDVDSNALSLVIYNGVDRSANQSTRESVIFRQDTGALTGATQVKSMRNYKNVAYVLAPVGFRAVYAPGTPTTVSGFDRRVLQVSATDITTVGSGTVTGVLKARGLKELAKYNKIDYFSAGITPDGPFEYGVDYGLGDIVTLVGSYGFNASMRVSEYIRVENQEGERGYPSLVVLEGDAG